MNRLSSGHRTLDVSIWSGGSFPVPQQLRDQFQLPLGAFDLADCSASRDYAAFRVQGSSLIVTFAEIMEFFGGSLNHDRCVPSPFGMLTCARVVEDHGTFSQLAQPVCQMMLSIERHGCFFENTSNHAILETSTQFRKQTSEQVQSLVAGCELVALWK